VARAAAGTNAGSIYNDVEERPACSSSDDFSLP
jgi:hypothetical protein